MVGPELFVTTEFDCIHSCYHTQNRNLALLHKFTIVRISHLDVNASFDDWIVWKSFEFFFVWRSLQWKAYQDLQYSRHTLQFSWVEWRNIDNFKSNFAQLIKIQLWKQNIYTTYMRLFKVCGSKTVSKKAKEKIEMKKEVKWLPWKYFIVYYILQWKPLNLITD